MKSAIPLCTKVACCIDQPLFRPDNAIPPQNKNQDQTIENGAKKENRPRAEAAQGVASTMLQRVGGKAAWESGFIREKGSTVPAFCNRREAHSFLREGLTKA